MDIHAAWEKALKATNIHRNRAKDLATFAETKVHYILLSSSSVNLGDTVVRKGEVIIQQPSIVLPPNVPQFLGFDFEKESDFKRESIMNFLLVRGVAIPSLKYDNKTQSLDIFEGDLKKAIGSYCDDLERREDVNTGLLSGPDECWQFSLLIFLCSQVARNAQTDIQRLMDEFRKNQAS